MAPALAVQSPPSTSRRAAPSASGPPAAPSDAATRSRSRGRKSQIAARFFARGSSSGRNPGSIARSPASRRSAPASPGRARNRSSNPRSRSPAGVRSIPGRWPPSAVGTPTIDDRSVHRRHRAASWSRAHRRVRPRAVLRALGVRRRPPAVRIGRRGLPDGRPARPGRRRDARTVGRPSARLHGVDRPSAPPRRDRVALRHARTRRRPDLRRSRGGRLLPDERPARAGRPRGRDLARLPEPVRGRPGGRRRGHPPRAARAGRLGARPRPAAQAGHAGDPADRRQRPAQPDRHAAGPCDVRRARGHRRRVGRLPAPR